jgi:hypothetical protein
MVIWPPDKRTEKGTFDMPTKQSTIKPCPNCGIMFYNKTEHCSVKCYKNIHFWSLIEKTNYCWIWRGYRNKGGYGSNGIILTHRKMWKITYGEIPPKMFVLHRCDNRSCVNPKHLFLGTQVDNMKDMVEKGRSTKGRSHKASNCKLKEKDIIEIKLLYSKGHTQQEISVLYSVSQTNISRIIIGKTWKHIS